MFAVAGQPIHVFGTVVDCMESPEKRHAMLQTVAPVHEKIAQEHRFNGLQQPRFVCHDVVEICRHNRVDPASQMEKQPEYNTAPEQVTPQKEAEVHEKTR